MESFKSQEQIIEEERQEQEREDNKKKEITKERESLGLKKEEKKTYYEIQVDTLNSIVNLGGKKEFLKNVDYSKPIEKDSDATIIKEFKIFEDGIKEGILKEPGKKEEIEKIKIELSGNGILTSDFADTIGNKFKETDELYYKQDLGEIVEINLNGFSILKANRFITIIEKYFIPYSECSHGEVIKSVNVQTANIVLSSPNFQDKIKKIERIFPVPIPVIYQGKLTFPKKRYDERFNSWLPENSPTINENMDLEEATKIILKIYSEFCFQDGQGLMNAIAGLITPFCRGLFSSFNVRTPLFAYLGNRERAGKDYCAGITGIVYDGSNYEEPPISSGNRGSGDNEELRKKLTSSLIAGKKRLHFANNKGLLDNATLEGFLTSRYWSNRLLGQNKSVDFSNEIDVSLSGNIGMKMTPDLVNRSILITLFLDIEDANKRIFENPNLHKGVLENRSLILSAIYCLIKNWFDKGMPKGSVKFSSFPEWAEICGGIMECAGLGNPCNADKNLCGISLDEETEEMKNFFEFMYEHFPDKYMTKQEIKDILLNSEDNPFPYLTIEDKSSQTKFGIKLSKFSNRILSDIRLICENVDIKASRRRYKFVKEKSNLDKNTTLD